MLDGVCMPIGIETAFICWWSIVDQIAIWKGRFNSIRDNLVLEQMYSNVDCRSKGIYL